MESPTKIVLPSLGAHVFGLKPDPKALTMNVPPLIETPNGWDLDYGPLLLFEKVIIDTHAKKIINESGDREYRNLKESFHILEEEGIAEFHDYKLISENTLSKLEDVLEKDLPKTDPLGWREQTRATMQNWQFLSKGLFNNSTSRIVAKDKIPFGIWHYLKKNHLKLNSKEVDRILNLFQIEEKKLSTSEQEIIREVSQVYLRSINNSMLISRELNGNAIHDWSNFGDFYIEKNRRFVNIQEGEFKRQEKIRELFNTMPEYCPENAGEFIGLKKNSQIKFLRNFINDAAKNNVVLDKDFHIEMLKKVNSIQERKKSFHAKLGYLRYIWIYAMEPVSHLTSMIGEIVLEGTELGAHLFNNRNKELKWFLLLSKFMNEKEERLNKSISKERSVVFQSQEKTKSVKRK